MAAKMLINIQLGLIFLLSAPGSAVLGCVVLQLHFSGLAANLNGLLASLPAFDETNGTVYIDNAMFPYKCSDEGGLFDFFVPGLLQPYTGTIQQQQCRYYIFDKMRDFAREIGVAFCDSKYDPAIVHKLWRLQPSVRKEVDEAIQAMQAYKAPTIAFHVRGGDKPTEDERWGRKTTTAADLVDTYLDNFSGMKGGTCVLFGDEQKALVETERLVREHIGCHVVHGSQYYRPQGHLQAAFNDQPVQERCSATIQLIKDLELMANADYFIGSSTSGLPPLVAAMRIALYQKAQVTYADATYNDKGANIRRFWGMGGFKNVTVASSRRAMRELPK